MVRMCRQEVTHCNTDNAADTRVSTSSAFLQYLSEMGVCRVLGLLFALVAGQIAWIFSEWWLTEWAQRSPESQHSGLFRWLGMYSTLVAGMFQLACFLVFVCCFWQL